MSAPYVGLIERPQAYTDMGLALGVWADAYIRSLNQRPELARYLEDELAQFDVKTVTYNVRYQQHIAEGLAIFTTGLYTVAAQKPEILSDCFPYPDKCPCDSQNPDAPEEIKTKPVAKLIYAKFKELECAYAKQKPVWAMLNNYCCF